MKAAVLTVSDGVSAGARTDESGPAVSRLLSEAGFEVSDVQVVPDERQRITGFLLARCSDHDLVVTTGGTGLAARDVTPEATRSVIAYEVPGLAELMRSVGVASTPLAALSRSLAGVREHTLIINLPGSVKGATESLQAVLPTLGHAVQLLKGEKPH